MFHLMENVCHLLYSYHIICDEHCDLWNSIIYLPFIILQYCGFYHAYKILLATDSNIYYSVEWNTELLLMHPYYLAIMLLIKAKYLLFVIINVQKRMCLPMHTTNIVFASFT